MLFAILLIILLFLILLMAYYAYRIAFQAHTFSSNTEDGLPIGEQYEVHYDTIRRCIDRMKALPCEDCYISSFDNLRLYGRFYKAAEKAPVHLMFHGYKSTSFLDSCGGAGLALSLDHNVLLADQRGHGKSEGKTITFGIRERYDVLSWITYINETFGEDTPIFLWGLSMGAATVLMASDLELPKNVVGILADCPYSSPRGILQKVCGDLKLPPKFVYPFLKLGALLFGGFNPDECSALTNITNNKLPILLFHGLEDRFVPWEMSREIKDAASDLITLELFPDAGHGLCFMMDAPRYQKAAIDFIKKCYHAKRPL